VTGGPRNGRAWTFRLVTVAVVSSIAAIGWLGYQAVHGWRDSAALLAEQRAAETAERLATVLSRDMRGVQTAVLASDRWDQFVLDPPSDARNLAASAFARYPYPESFFAWRGEQEPSGAVFLNRSDRRPPWMAGSAVASPFPVVVDHDAGVAASLQARIRSDAAVGRRFSVFAMTLGATQYQVVARLVYRDALREQLEGVFGYTVNLPWVRRHYFAQVARQVARIGDTNVMLPLAVLDASGAPVPGMEAPALRAPIARRGFPLAFFDPLLLTANPPDLPRETWQAAAGAGSDPSLGEALEGGNRTLVVAACATIALVLGLVMTGRATRWHAAG